MVTLTDEGTLVSGTQQYRRQKIYSDSLGRQWKTEVLNWDGSVYSTTTTTLNALDQATLVRQWSGPENGGGAYQDTTMTYDVYGRLQSKHVPEQDANTATTYTYNNDDTINSVTDARGFIDPSYPGSPPVENAHNFDRAYNYDHIGRLTTALTGNEARGGTTADGPYKETYQYDVWDHMNGRVNRIWSKPLDSFTANYVNNRNHDPLSSWQYDADGNATRDDNGTNVFDAAGRKTSVPTWVVWTPPGSASGNPEWDPAPAQLAYDADGYLVKEDDTLRWGYSTYHRIYYYVRSTVLNGRPIFRYMNDQTNGTGVITREVSICAGDAVIARSTDGNVGFEHSEPFTGVRNGLWGVVIPDPLGQEVGSYDPGSDDPGDVGRYPEPHEYGRGDDPGLGCVSFGVPVPCGQKIREESLLGSLLLPHLDRALPRTDPLRTPPIFPNAQSQISPRQVLSDIFAGTPVGSIFFPRPEDLWKYIIPINGFAPQDNGKRWIGGDRLSDCYKKLLKPYFAINLGDVSIHHYIPLGPKVWSDPDGYTFGYDVYFKNYNPSTEQGLTDLLHELTHVQQFEELGYIGFPKEYLKEYRQNRKQGMSDQDAYFNIRLEKEARQHAEETYKNIIADNGGKNPCANQ